MANPIKLVTLHGASELPAEVLLDQLIVSFGRSTNNILSLNDHKVSRYHGEISLEEDGYVIRDLGSTNGVSVNGRRVEAAPLSPGDVVQIGDTRFRVDPAVEIGEQGSERRAPSFPGRRSFQTSGDAIDPAALETLPFGLESEPAVTPGRAPETSGAGRAPESRAAAQAFAIATTAPFARPAGSLDAALADPPTVVVPAGAMPEPQTAVSARRSGAPGLVIPVRGLRDAAAASGWDALRAWLGARALSASPAGQRYGLPAPRALTIVAPPGCGKTHLWRHLAAAHELEAVRLELANLVLAPPGTWVDATRAAVDAVDGARRTLVALDDLDQVLGRLAGLGAAAKDAAAAAGEVLVRWLAERDDEPLVVITASSRHLHPALLRRGPAVTEVFWLDLPGPSERAALLNALLERHGVNGRNLDTAEIARAADGFSHAQLAFLVEDALFAAVAERRDVGTEHLLAARAGVTPAALSAAIGDLRRWALACARPAVRGTAEGA